ncbi:DUF3592 domain-containing protein [Marinifilum fragile]|uniref:DUF3592 domain-containing protein n=1 Tax=Marinifilum fragile TaxID=570161 RepID=UPI002AA68B80|nr:DUF3592 domain-containing protein [Marinifilum fragile]
MKKQTSAFGTLVFAIVFFVGGLMAWQHFTKPMLEEAKESEHWPTVQGIITVSELNKTRNNDGNDMYSANVHYTYIVKDKTYSSSGIKSVDGSTSIKSSVKNTIKKYAKGKNVKVYYDPEFPETAVLEPGAGLLMGVLLRIPLLFCAFSVLMVFGLTKRLLFGR